MYIYSSEVIWFPGWFHLMGNYTRLPAQNCDPHSNITEDRMN